MKICFRGFKNNIVHNLNHFYFYFVEHQNWFGNDENLGPVAISIKKEKIEHSDNSKNSNNSLPLYQFRIIIRTSEVSKLKEK